MKASDWYRACCLLIEAGIIDARLTLLVRVEDAMQRLRRSYIDLQRGDHRSAPDDCSKLKTYRPQRSACTAKVTVVDASRVSISNVRDPDPA